MVPLSPSLNLDKLAAEGAPTGPTANSPFAVPPCQPDDGDPTDRCDREHGLLPELNQKSSLCFNTSSGGYEGVRKDLSWPHDRRRSFWSTSSPSALSGEDEVVAVQLCP